MQCNKPTHPPGRRGPRSHRILWGAAEDLPLEELEELGDAVGTCKLASLKAGEGEAITHSGIGGIHGRGFVSVTTARTIHLSPDSFMNQTMLLGCLVG